MRAFVISTTVSIFILSTSLCVASSKEPIAFVPDAKTAAAVAEAIIKGQIGEEKYEVLQGSHRLIVHSDGNVWTCSFYLKNVLKHGDLGNGLEGVAGVAGEGTPVVEISKVDGRVLRFSHTK